MLVVIVDQPLLERFHTYHETHITWGSLHIVLDDGNVENKYVDFVMHWAETHDDTEGLELAKLLRDMTMTQRRKVASRC